MTDYAPIAVFAYRRPRHLQRTLEALSKCPEFLDSPLYIFVDGPKSDAAESGVRAVREVVGHVRHPRLTVQGAEQNQGLAKSIISGVSSLCQKYGRVIVIEDDIVLKPCALEWFNTGLSAYSETDSIFQITAYQFRVPEWRRRQHGVLLPFTSSWGWATWQRAWTRFDPDVIGHERLHTDVKFRAEYNLNGSFPMAEHLMARLSGTHDTWASRWYWAFYNANARALFPPASLVTNIGLDETATHNNVGWLKRFAASRPPFEWSSPTAPRLPDLEPTTNADLQIFQRALRRTGAMRNVKIKNTLRRLGLWNPIA